MNTQLVLIHGRSQEHKNAVALKAEWLDALNAGLNRSNLQLPISESDVRFPYYGDTLFDMAEGAPADVAAQIVVRGNGLDSEEQSFTRAVMEEIRHKSALGEAQLAEVGGQEVLARGPQNWAWVQAILRSIDQLVPHGSATAIALFTHDVYQYLKSSSIRQQIEAGVAGAITPGIETVVVSHSLGTVVAYNLLRREGHLRNWRIKMLVTVGSPLAIVEIRKALKSFAPTRCPECVTEWFNAMDARDVVALYPLDPANFPLDPLQPAIYNKTDVQNRTPNRHGIGGYLDDAEVARLIHDALL